MLLSYNVKLIAEESHYINVGMGAAKTNYNKYTNALSLLNLRT